MDHTLHSCITVRRRKFVEDTDGQHVIYNLVLEHDLADDEIETLVHEFERAIGEVMTREGWSEWTSEG